MHYDWLMEENMESSIDKYINISQRSKRLIAALMVASLTMLYGQQGKLKKLSASELTEINGKKEKRVEKALVELKSQQKKLGKLLDGHSFETLIVRCDEFGVTHANILQRYNGIPLLGGGITLHVDNDEGRYTISGEMESKAPQEPQTIINSDEAIYKVLLYLGIKYNITSLLPKHFKVEKVYRPASKRTIREGVEEKNATPLDVSYRTDSVDLVYKLTLAPPERPNVSDLRVPWHSFKFSDILVNAVTGEVVGDWENRMPQSPMIGTGRSSMYGNRSVAFVNNLDYDSFSNYNYLYSMIYLENGSLRIQRQKPDEEFVEIIPYDGGYTDPIPPPTIIYHWPYTTSYSAPDPYGFIGDGKFYVTCGYSDFYLNSSSVAVDVYYGIDAAHKVLTIPFGRSSGQSELQNYTIMMDKLVDNSYTSSSESTIYLRNYSRHSNLACDGTYTINGHSSSGYHTSANVVCHELGHALINRTANFNYYASYHLGFLVANSESAGLHEGNAEIFSAFAVQYGRQGMDGLLITPNTNPVAVDGLNFDNYYDVPAKVYDSKLWAHPDQTTVFNSSFNVNYWSAPLGGGFVEVHDAGKPAERFICYLILGGFNDFNQRLDQRYNPWVNMDGIGMDAAYRIWHRGVTVYCGQNTTYLTWLYALANAAKDLHGNPSAELSAVKNAAKAININIDGYNP